LFGSGIFRTFHKGQHRASTAFGNDLPAGYDEMFCEEVVITHTTPGKFVFDMGQLFYKCFSVCSRFLPFF